MNGARTTFMRRGYLLTALSALLLLAASAGTASAQSTGITITGPAQNTVGEGGTATYTVTVRGYVGPADSSTTPPTATNPGSFDVTLNAPTGEAAGTATAGEVAATAGDPSDLNTNLQVLSVSFDPPANSSTVRRLFTQSKTISLPTLHDNDAEDEHFTLSFPAVPEHADFYVSAAATDTTLVSMAASSDARTTPPNSLTIKDDETQTYTLTLSATHSQPGMAPREGTQAATVELKASPPHVQGMGTLQVNLDKQTGWTLDIGDVDTDNPAIVTNSGADTTVELTITQNPGDGNRVTDTVTVSAHAGVIGASREVASLSIDFADANLLQAVTAKVVDKDGRALATQPTSVEEGETVMIAVMPVDKDGKVTTANEALKIALASSGTADSQDFRLSEPIAIGNGQDVSNVVELMVESDEDVGMEMLVLDATVSGAATIGPETRAVANVLSLGIEDATSKKIWTKSQDDAYPKITAAIEAGAGDEGLNPGESFEINTSDLFGYAEGYTASFSAASDSEAVSVSASGSTVTAMAESAGSAKVTITGTARMASSSFKAEQTISNVADVTFEVTVVDKMLMLTLDAPGAMEGNVVEGMDYDVTVTANRAVHDDTEVMFMRSDMSEADVRDYSIEGVTIMAGEMMATATLMVTEDMEDDAGHAMGEALHLYAMAGDTMSNTLELTIWDEAVPALPLIGQLLLALFLMAGGARLYRRRQS